MAWETSPNDYPLENRNSLDVSTPESLVSWMDDAVARYETEYGPFENGSEIGGRAYIASTIRYHSDLGLVQTGSAPGYFGDLWSLSTCRKDIRSSAEFVGMFTETEDGVYRPNRPVFVLPFSSRSRSYDKPGTTYQRSLASAALVTHGFREMGNYAEFLIDHFSGVTVENRLSHGGDPSAEERGDCHADWNGEVHYPPDRHQHGDDSSHCGCGTSTGRHPADHIDNQPHHVKCASMPGYWISWNEPTLAMDRENEFRHKTIDGSSTIHDRIEPMSDA